MAGTIFKPGDFNIIDERTGRKIKRSEARKEWTNRIVSKESFEYRHPQDFLRSFPDHQAVEDARTEATDGYLATNQVTETDFDEVGTEPGVLPTVWDDGASEWDGGFSRWDEVV
jgi:hypothetical protein